MRAESRAEQVVRVVRPRHPVAHRFVDGILQRTAARIDRLDPGAQQSHPEDIQRLPAHVLGAHVDDALEAQERTGRRAGDAVLSGPGLGDDPLLPHALGKKRLAESVVDLVGAGVGQVFPLEKDPGAAVSGREPSRIPERRRAARVVVQEPGKLGNEGSIATSLEVLALERFDGRDQGLGHEATAELAVVAAPIGIAAAEPIPGLRHCSSSIASSAGSASAQRTASTKCRSRRWLFTPGRSSTPEATSTPYGRTV